MDIYAVLGQPISHSKSPQIHKLFAEQVGASLVYGALEVAPDKLAETLKGLHENGYKGLNATLPHKAAVAALCENVSARAEIGGAVNTLVRTATGWQGDNTDGEGLIQDLKNLGISIKNKRVLVLGAGGAARGILKPLLDEKPAELALSNRNPWKPEELAEKFKPHGSIRPVTHIALKGDLFDVIINATSAGHGGAMPRLPGQLLAKGGACYDLNYGKAFEPFAQWARTQNAVLISDGLGMLVEQAASAFQLWRGVRPNTQPVIAQLRKPVSDDADSETLAEDGKPRDRATHAVLGEDCGKKL